MSDQARILVVDDEEVIREVLADFLSMEDYAVSTASDGQQALARIDEQRFDLVLSDLKMPVMGGLELLDELQRRHLSTKAVIMTGFGTVETAIEAMKRGATDYILKPFRVEEVVLTVRRAIDERRLEAENLRLRDAVGLYEASERIAATLSLQDILQAVTSASRTGARADVAELLLLEHGHLVEKSRHGDAPIAIDGHALLDQLEDGLAGIRLHGEEAARFAGDGAAPGALLVVPLVEGGEILGLLSVARLDATDVFDEGQRKLTAMLAHRAAAAITNARLFAGQQLAIQQTIEGLARAIDKLDPYTAGHSDRVALYASLLAREMKLDEAEIDRIRNSAQMHDIGKIGCHVNLNKPGKLTADEYEDFKKHTIYGQEILEPIGFLAPLVPGVLLHHERIDGKGYPFGLPAEEIPQIARIICIADSYDAMTSDRAYRKALPHEVAIAEILRCSGTQFDSDLVPLFVRAIERWRMEQSASGLAAPR
ncbi:MAG: response regulator [Myxococcales bacterium]|nr:response regulator [Myxococcales bacterium]